METYSGCDENRAESVGPESVPTAIAAGSNSNPLNVAVILGNCNSGNVSARQSPKVSVTPASQLIIQGNPALSPTISRKIMSKNNNNTS